jgi:hypothetical protein
VTSRAARFDRSRDLLPVHAEPQAPGHDRPALVPRVRGQEPRRGRLGVPDGLGPAQPLQQKPVAAGLDASRGEQATAVTVSHGQSRAIHSDSEAGGQCVFACLHWASDWRSHRRPARNSRASSSITMTACRPRRLPPRPPPRAATRPTRAASIRRDRSSETPTTIRRTRVTRSWRATGFPRRRPIASHAVRKSSHPRACRPSCRARWISW